MIILKHFVKKIYLCRVTWDIFASITLLDAKVYYVSDVYILLLPLDVTQFRDTLMSCHIFQEATHNFHPKKGRKKKEKENSNAMSAMFS